MPPTIAKQTPPKPVIPKTASLNGAIDILDTAGIPIAELQDDYINLALYGRNGIGKTTMACMLKKPLALFAIDPSPTGGARSVKKMDGVTVYRIAGYPLIDPKTGKLEKLWGSAKALAITEALSNRYARGERPFESVVIDGVTSWGEVILQEVMGVTHNDMPAILGFGKVGQDQYTERGERMIRYLRTFIDMPCNVAIIAQERDHNPPKDDRGRVIGTKLIRPAQENSFFSLDVGASPATWIQNACDFVCQMYEDDEYRKDVQTITVGNTTQKVEQMLPTGRRVRRMRMLYHTNYAARCRNSEWRTVPEYIQADTPEQRWEAFMDVVRGKKTKYGFYPPTTAAT